MTRWRTPRWWYRRDPRSAIARAVMEPLARIWADRTAARIRAATPIDPGAPVICVGNLTAGGSGKTPVAVELARILREDGERVAILSSGYGGRLRGPVSVDSALHGAKDVGDEALLMSQAAPAVIARDRVAGARLAVADGARVIVTDDGHQNPVLRKALSIVVVDGETRGGEWPFGAGGVIPAGPMREPLNAGLARADVVVALLPIDMAYLDPELRAVFGDKEVWIARLTADSPPPAGPRFGFAGVAKPWRVERTLRSAGCDLVGFEAFADHAPLGGGALRKLARRAAAMNAGLITTEKDWVRLPLEWRSRIDVFRVRARFDDEPGVRAALSRVVGWSRLSSLND